MQLLDLVKGGKDISQSLGFESIVRSRLKVSESHKSKINMIYILANKKALDSLKKKPKNLNMTLVLPEDE
jgi:hypothetical protein